MFLQKLPELLKKITKLSRKIRSKDIIGTIKSHVEKIGHGKEKKTEGEIWIPPTTWFSNKTDTSDRRGNTAENAVYTCINNADHEEGGSGCSLGISTIQAQWVKEPEDTAYAAEEHEKREGRLELTNERANNNSTWKSLLLFQFNGEPSVFHLTKRHKHGTSTFSLTYFRPGKDVIRMDVPAENSDDLDSMKERILLQMLSSSVFINTECCMSAEMDHIGEPFPIDFSVHEIKRFAVFLSSKLMEKKGSQNISKLKEVIAPKNQGYELTGREENLKFPLKIMQSFSLQTTRCITWKENLLVLGCKALLYCRGSILELVELKITILLYSPCAVEFPEIWQNALVRNSMTGNRMNILDCICFDGKILLQLEKNVQLQLVKNRVTQRGPMDKGNDILGLQNTVYSVVFYLIITGIYNAEDEQNFTSSLPFVNMAYWCPINKTFAGNAIQRGNNSSRLATKDVNVAKVQILQEDDGLKKIPSMENQLSMKIFISKSVRLHQISMFCFPCSCVESGNCFSPKANTIAVRSAYIGKDIHTENNKRSQLNQGKQIENACRDVQNNYKTVVDFKESKKKMIPSDDIENNFKKDVNLLGIEKTVKTPDEDLITDTKDYDQGVGKMARTNYECQQNCRAPKASVEESHGRRHILDIGVLSFQYLTSPAVFLIFCLMFFIDPSKANQYTPKCNAVKDSVVDVSYCPKSYTKWRQRSIEKNCSFVSKYCGDLQLKYHCVLNDEKTGFVEVCAREHKIIDYKCPEFNHGIERIQAQISTQCDTCPWAYKSTHVYKYTECFDKIKRVNERNRTKGVSQEMERTTIFPETEWRETDLNETGQEIPTTKGDCQVTMIVFLSLCFFILLVIVSCVIRRKRKVKQKESFDSKEADEGCMIHSQQRRALIKKKHQRDNSFPSTMEFWIQCNT